jgi:hypothetical protein
MFSFGEEPYGEMLNKEVLDQLKQGHVLTCPESCPQVIYDDIILPCFNLDPSKRPNYKEIFRRLGEVEEFLKLQGKKSEIVYNTPPIERVSSDDLMGAYKDASEDIK